MTARLRAAAALAAEQLGSLSAEAVFARASTSAGRRRIHLSPPWARFVVPVIVAALLVIVFVAPWPLDLFGSPSRPPRAAGHATLRWTLMDLGPSSLDAVACPTASDCIALGPEGWRALSDDGGVTWTTSRMSAWSEVDFGALACPSPTTCVALGTTGDRSVILVSHDDGLEWRPAATSWPSLDLSGLSCPTARVCYSAASEGTRSYLLLETTDGGNRWTRRPAPVWLASCPVVGHCWATWNNGEVSVTGDGGRSWATQRLGIGAGGYPQIAALSCFSLTGCVGVGIEHHPGYPVTVFTSDGGRTWHIGYPPSPPSPEGGFAGGELSAVSCTRAGLCVAVGGYGPGTIESPLIYVTHNGGRTWAVPREQGIAGGSLEAVACFSGCVAVGTGQNEGALITGGSPSGPWTTRLQGVGSDWTSVSCPGAGECVAVGAGSSSPGGAQVLRTSDGWLTWARGRLPAGLLGISAVACPSVQSCYATAYQTTSPAEAREGTLWRSIILVSRDGGRSWRRQPTPGLLLLSGIACPSPSTCLAVGATDENSAPGHDAVLETTDAGRRWLRLAVPSPAGPGGLLGISCPVRTRCWAIGYGAVLATKNGGRTWFDQPGPSGTSISCPTERKCVTAGSENASGSTFIYVTSDGGGRWTGTWRSPVSATSPALSPTAVSCWDASHCLAAGQGTTGPVVLQSDDGGLRWTGLELGFGAGSFTYATAVRCQVSRRCVLFLAGPLGEVALSH